MLLALVLIAARPAQAQTYTVLYTFYGSGDGAYPQSSLTFGGAGNLYGTTTGGGLGYGTVFELSPNGSGGWNETVLYKFTGGADGANPTYSSVIFDSAGNLYGTTVYGGAYGLGVVFELSPVGGSWTETVLHSFAGGADGYYPFAGVIFDPAGNLYGTTGDGPNGEGGTVFELSPSGGGWTEQVIYNANYPCLAGLTMDAAGNIFGATGFTVFELSPNGNGGWNPTVTHTFAGPPKDGSWAFGTPVLDQAGNLYGTTYQGGVKNYGTVYELSPITKGKKRGQWKERIVHSFGGKTGNGPEAGVVFDAAGNIYGTTTNGGKYGDGTVFELVAQVGKSSYRPKVLWSFDLYTFNGVIPYGSLILDSAGNLYGTTVGGGQFGLGVVFELTP